MGKYLFVLFVIVGVGGLWWQRGWMTDTAVGLFTPDVRVESQVEGVRVRASNTELIESTLDEVGFTAPGQISQYNPNGLQVGRVMVRKLLVVLTPEEQAIGKTFGPGESAPYQSWGIAYSPTKSGGMDDVTIYLYVKDEIVQRERAEELGKRYQGLLLSAIWDLTHPKQPQDKEFARFEGMSEYKRDKLGKGWWEVQK